ncbi:MAG: pyridine nucleotide-disulfide oxidoreductase, partial [Burkholderiaceae bacterium]
MLLLTSLMAALWYSGFLEQLSLANLKAHQATWNAWVTAHPWLAASAFFAIYVLAAAASLPDAAILTLAGGALFGLVEG